MTCNCCGNNYVHAPTWQEMYGFLGNDHNITLYMYISYICLFYVIDGKFQAYMQVHIQNDGPVTIPLESPASLKDPKLAVSHCKAVCYQTDLR